MILAACLQVITVLGIIAVADYQSQIFARNQPIKWWFHSVWFLPFLASWILVWILSHNLLLVIKLVLLRVFLFNQILNLMRHRPFFYLNSDKNGSWWDSTLLKVDRYYPAIWSAGILAIIILNFFK